MVALAKRCEWADRGPETGCELLGVVRIHNMTYYDDQPGSYWCCRNCAHEYVQFWTEQWDESYAEIRAGLGDYY